MNIITAKRATPSLGVALTILCAAALLPTLGCSSTSSAPGGTVAGAQAISNCQTGCDQMKFFGCNSSSEQTDCYGDCNAATAAQINLFVNCAQTSICDPSCRNDIAPSNPPAPTPVSASDCMSACAKAAMCSIVPAGDQAGCEAQCGKSAYQYQIDCVNNNACNKIASACGFSSSSTGSPSTDAGPQPSPDAGNTEIPVCQQSCQILLATQCIDAPTQSACDSQCASSSQAEDQTFDQCVQASGATPGDCSTAMACLTTFQG